MAEVFCPTDRGVVKGVPGKNISPPLFFFSNWPCSGPARRFFFSKASVLTLGLASLINLLWILYFCKVAASLLVMDAGGAGKCMRACVCVRKNERSLKNKKKNKIMLISYYSLALSWSKKPGGMLIENDGSLSGDIMRPSYTS